jgi:methionyl aminopeptidase
MITMGTYKVVTDRRDGWTVTTLDGKPAAHYENTVLITENGVEILTL